jgi:hypothetical protein
MVVAADKAEAEAGDGARLLAAGQDNCNMAKRIDAKELDPAVEHAKRVVRSRDYAAKSSY